jgi:hypothetical protein
MAENELDARQSISAELLMVVADLDLTEANGSAEGGLKVLQEAKILAPKARLVIVSSGESPDLPGRVGRLGGICLYRTGENYLGVLMQVVMDIIAGTLHKAATPAPELMLHIPEPGQTLRFRVSPEDRFDTLVSASFTLESELLKAVSAAIGALTASEF